MTLMETAFLLGGPFDRKEMLVHKERCTIVIPLGDGKHYYRKFLLNPPIGYTTYFHISSAYPHNERQDNEQSTRTDD